jgi:ubiquinol-cytochrome c reductase cytochrome b subunit
MLVLVRQKHTQFPGPGRRDTNVVGSRMWPTYAFRSLSLLSAVGTVCVALGALVQINPVWLWGPFDPSGVTSPAQPDWYVGWMEGALRLFPPWDTTLFGYLVPAMFWPSVVLPGVTFAVLYAWPWLERWRTGDRVEHHVLQRPREAPARIALGVWALFFYGLLLVAGSDDIIARELHASILVVVWVLRVVVVVVPLVAAGVAYWLASSLRRSSSPTFVDMPASDLRRAAAGAARPEPAEEAS